MVGKEAGDFTFDEIVPCEPMTALEARLIPALAEARQHQYGPHSSGATPASLSGPIILMDSQGITASIPYSVGPDGRSIDSVVTWEEIDAFRAGGKS